MPTRLPPRDSGPRWPAALIGFSALGLSVVGTARAEGPSRVAVARAGGGQSALAVGFTARGELIARVCAAGPCGTEGGDVVPLPAETSALAPGARLTIAPLGEGRRAVVVEIPDPKGLHGFAAVIAAPAGGQKPLVVWSGSTALVEDAEGNRAGESVVVRSEGVYVGTLRDGSDLCGRPALLAPRAVDPVTLTLKPSKLQRLTEAEREKATPLTPEPATDAEAVPPALLRATWATSAAPGQTSDRLTDGRIDTAWAEGRGGPGRGEFVAMRSPREVTLGAFRVALPPAGTTPPSQLFLATDHELFSVAIPAELSKTPGARLDLRLPVPLKTSCVAAVVEGAEAKGKDADVGLAEVWAVPFGTVDTAALVATLAGGGPDAEAAGAVLRASGPEALAALAARFPDLDEGGRRVALDVLDDAPCDVALSVYIAALVGPYDGQRTHARGAFARCGPAGAIAMAAALEGAKPAERVILADELATFAPRLCVSALVPRLSKASASERRAFRAAIFRATESPEARAEAGRALDLQVGDPRGTLELLRALGARLSSAPDVADPGERALVRVARAGAPFRSRYLLLAPAAELSAKGGSARAVLRASLTTDASVFVRAEAARVLRAPADFQPELARLLADPSPRAREAAAQSFGRGKVDAASSRLAYALDNDAWPIVRIAAAQALAGLSPSPKVDTALVEALDDDSIIVRRVAIAGLGSRNAVAAGPVLLGMLQDDEQNAYVRAAAAAALGSLCSKEALDTLYVFARRLASARALEGDRIIGKSAVTALGRMKPGDLAERLAPLRAKQAPAAVRYLAEGALREAPRCAKPAPR